MRWEPFEARLCALSVSAALHAGSFVAPLSVSYEDERPYALATHAHIYASTHLSDVCQ